MIKNNLALNIFVLNNIMNSEKKILLIFLGGTPNVSNIIKHWITLNNKFTTINNYYLVIHPIILSDFIINHDFKQIFNIDNIYIVNEEHHLLTDWGTKSLSDATLLMMEYAHKQNNQNLFDKYILLSPNCCPLYNLDEIYKVITSNDKSWLSTVNEINLLDDIKGNKQKVFEPKYLKFNMTYYNFSQWMILDKKHVQFFFPHNTPIYEKKLDSVICNNPINIIKLTAKASHIKSCKLCLELYYYLNSYKDCDLSDEKFFGSYIFYKLLESNDDKLTAFERLTILKDNIENLSVDNFKHNLQQIPKSILESMNQINTTNLSTITLINPLEKLEYIIQYDIELYNYLIDSQYYNKIKIITEYNSLDDSEDLDIHILDDTMFLKKSTFTDWSLISINPYNILRGLPLSIDIKQYLSSEDYIIDTYAKLNKLVKFELGYKKYSVPMSHPNEYSTWTFKFMLNAYYLLRYCMINNYTRYFDLDIEKAYLIYHKIICRELSIDSHLSDTNKDSAIYFYLLKKESLTNNELFTIIEEKIKINRDILYKIYGTPITNTILISALGLGSLFIRKCNDTSLIETYSDILKSCVYNNPITNEIKEIKEIKINSLFDLNLYKKYLKYKLKYMNLKNRKQSNY